MATGHPAIATVNGRPQLIISANRRPLSASSDDGIKAWLNGQLVVSHDVQRGTAPGQEQVTVDLRVGWNEVLLEITQGHGGWGLYFDLFTPEGKTLPDLVYAARKGRPQQ